MQSRCNSKIGIFVPTLNAEKSIETIISAINESSLDLENLFVIDSESTDSTVEILKKRGIAYRTVKREEFSHGRVRRDAINHFRKQADFVIMLTQDVVFGARELNKLVTGIVRREDVGVSYMRQVCTKKHTVEFLDRQFNYPKTSAIKNAATISVLGPSTFFSSDAFAIYRVQAVISVGNFPANVDFSEDSYMAAKLVLAGWSVYYNADAKVIHNNIANYKELYFRYRHISEFFSDNQWLTKKFGSNYKKGIDLVKFELGQAVSNLDAKLFLNVLIASSLKFIAYKLPNVRK